MASLQDYDRLPLPWRRLIYDLLGLVVEEIEDMYIFLSLNTYLISISIIN